MSVPYDFEVADQEQEAQPADWGKLQPIPVKVEHTQDERVAAEVAAHTTWNIPEAGAGQAVTICPHLYKRYKAQMQVNISGGATAIVLNSQAGPLNSANPQGSIWYPPAGATVYDLPPYESMRKLHAIAIGGTATISVMDQSYKTVQ